MRAPFRHALRIAAVLSLAAATVPFADRAPSASADGIPPLGIIVRGHGFGHGRGLSQYGALGWATKFNWTWQQILDFYYSGSGRTISTLGTVATDANMTPGGVMSVRLTTQDGRQTAAVSDNSTLQWTGRAGTYASLIARPVARNTYDVFGSASVSCGATSGTPSGFTVLARGVAGPVDFTTVNGSNAAAVSPTQLVGVCEPSTSSYKARIRYYRGGVRAVTDGSGNYRTVNLVTTESYVRGVVPRESPAGWGDSAGGLGMNALRAQAVAARSYALSETRYSYAKTCDTQDCQVYGGAGLRTVGSTSAQVLEDARSDRAVAETANVIIRASDNNVVRTEFTSSNGGRTAGGIFPARADDGDIAADATLQSWSRLISAKSLQAKYPSIGVLMSVTTQHDGLGGDFGGYATQVVISGTAGSVTRSAWNFRSDWDLNNSWYDTFPIPGVDPAAAPVGSVLFIGDSVAESIATEFNTVITPAYPDMNFQACAGRGMAGSACLFAVTAPQVNMDGVGIASTAFKTPAIAVVELGYNDDPNTYNAEVQQMLAALTTRAVQRVVFVNMSQRSQSRNYAMANAALAAAAANPAVTVLDWNAASSAPHQWRWFDNTSLCCWVHLSTTGQAEFTMFLRTQLDALRAGGLLPVTASTAATLPGLPIRKGNRGEMVRTVQKTLNTVMKLKGARRLGTDGQFGPGTSKVVRAFQRQAALTVTGYVDRATWDALGLGARPDLAVLKVGSSHPSVSTVQRALGKVLRKKVSVTGQFTSSTAADVVTYQKRAKLNASGKVGHRTWTSLMAAYAAAS